jgi:hypothetical protein
VGVPHDPGTVVLVPVQNEITGPYFAYERIGPVLLTSIVGLRSEQVGADVLAIRDLQPVTLARVVSPPLVYGHGLP